MNVVLRSASAATPSQRRSPTGFTLIEMLVVIAIMGVVLAMALPKTRALAVDSAVTSAKQQMAASIETARAYAVLHGTTTQLQFATDDVWITRTRRNGAQVTVKPAITFLQSYGVTFTAPDGMSQIVFDPRGIATSLSGSTMIRFTRSGVSDSLCVSRVGLVTSNCGQ